MSHLLNVCWLALQDNGAGAPIHFATTYKQLDMVGGRGPVAWLQALMLQARPACMAGTATCFMRFAGLTAKQSPHFYSSWEDDCGHEDRVAPLHISTCRLMEPCLMETHLMETRWLHA